MDKDIFTFIIGGKAGQGIKKAGTVAANLFSDLKREVFLMTDYPSLIRGGHNFCAVSSSTAKIFSHYMNSDLIVLLDQRSYNIHKNHVNKDGILVFNSDKVNKKEGIGIPISSESKNYDNSDLIEGITGIAILTNYLNIDKNTLDSIIKKEYKKNVEQNISYAHTIYDKIDDMVNKKIDLKQGKKTKVSISGAESISLGAVAAGLDIYFAYPMTPSTPLLHFFARNGKQLGVVSVQPESEIAVANMAIGASITGARSMVGTSGGGFSLMQEAFSLAGMIESPVLFLLGQRPGPSTGVPTYTEQGELLYSLYPGQGEFPRIVASPGSVEQAFYLTAELLNLIWRFQTPGILLSEKHLTESRKSVDISSYNTNWYKPTISKSKDYHRYRNTKNGVSPLLFPPSDQSIKWNSYEHDKSGFTTEERNMIKEMHEKRYKKFKSLKLYIKENIKTVNTYGSGSPIVFTFGSTTMSVLESLDYSNMNATVVQPIYLQPFPIWNLKKYKGKEAVIVEQNCTGQLEYLLKQIVGIKPVLSIRQFDGRPFNPIELSEKLKEAI